jgi:hypothetical protein
MGISPLKNAQFKTADTHARDLNSTRLGTRRKAENGAVTEWSPNQRTAEEAE